MSDTQHDATMACPETPEEPLLTPQRVFVVQFYPQTDPSTAQFSGRIEHVVSGQRCRFTSLEALMAFVSQVLGHSS